MKFPSSGLWNWNSIVSEWYKNPTSRWYNYYKVHCNLLSVNAYVANGGWVPRSLETGTADPNPGRTPHKPALPAPQPRAPPTSNLFLVINYKLNNYIEPYFKMYIWLPITNMLSSGSIGHWFVKCLHNKLLLSIFCMSLTIHYFLNV